MKINIIVAHCKNMGIGKNNDIPWKIKSDIKKFYTLTKDNDNNALIMGKNTYNSLKKPLKYRDNLILSNTMNIDEKYINNEIVKTFTNINNIMDFCYKKNYNTIWIIGGEKIYSYFLNDNILKNKINNIYVTKLDAEYQCDTFFPIIDTKIFRCISKQKHKLDTNYNEYNDYIDFNVWDLVYKNIHSIS